MRSWNRAAELAKAGPGRADSIPGRAAIKLPRSTQPSIPPG